MELPCWPWLLTRYASGEFTAVLRLQPGNDNSDRLDLGILRKPQDDFDVAEKNESWVPLIKNVGSLEISYFDPKPTTGCRGGPGERLPSLVKVSVGRPDATDRGKRSSR